MPLILGTNSIKDTGYDVANSLRFNDGSSDHLKRTFSTADNYKKQTFSAWIKRSDLGGTKRIIESYDGSSSSSTGIHFVNDQVRVNFGGSSSNILLTNALYRDVSAWYHLVVQIDTTQSTDTNRVKIYINGEQETSFATSNYPSQNTNSQLTCPNANNSIGTTYDGSGEFFDGYMAEVVFIDGQALDPTSFGEFDADTGIWKPIDVSGLTFGNNGFYLDYENSGSLGADVSGNGNNFTVNNLTSIDQTTDTCTNNFATLNPLIKGSGSYLSEGNLKGTQGSQSHVSLVGTIGVSTGKWYFEAKVTSIASSPNATAIGVCNEDCTVFKDSSFNAGDNESFVYVGGANYQTNGGEVSYGNSYTTNDIIGVAIDLDNNALYFSKNGTFQNSGDPTSGASKTGAKDLTANKIYFPMLGLWETTWEINLGGGTSFTISSGNSDGNGYGNFEYAVPSSYYSLCTKNLAEYG